MPTPSTAQGPRDGSVWRLSLLWGEAVLDVVTVGGLGAGSKPRALRLRTGDVVFVHGDDEGLRLGLGRDADDSVCRAGDVWALPSGHSLLVAQGRPEPRTPLGVHLDSTLFHAVMVGAALQVCVVSAFVLAPEPGLDPDGGAGIEADMRRYLSLSGGTARTLGRATFAAPGRTPELAERHTPPERTRGTSAPRAGKPLTFEEALDELRRTADRGTEGAQLQEALGAAARMTATAPTLGAGLGGLDPKDPVDVGVGTGTLGAGQSNVAATLRRRDQEARLRDRKVPRSAPAPDRVVPVSLIDVPDAHVTFVGGEDIDPVVKDHLQRAVVRRHNAIRYCYESWGLAADARQSGRLILELTLHPDGTVSAPHAVPSHSGLDRVAGCVERMVGDWYLGGGLVEEPRRLSFPFVLQPRAD